MRIIPSVDYVVAHYIPKYVPQTNNEVTDGGLIIPFVRNNSDPVSVFKISESLSTTWGIGTFIIVRDCDASITFNNLFIINIGDILGRIEE